MRRWTNGFASPKAPGKIAPAIDIVSNGLDLLVLGHVDGAARRGRPAPVGLDQGVLRRTCPHDEVALGLRRHCRKSQSQVDQPNTTIWPGTKDVLRTTLDMDSSALGIFTPARHRTRSLRP
jgi:hypothetical protein